MFLDWISSTKCFSQLCVHYSPPPDFYLFMLVCHCHFTICVYVQGIRQNWGGLGLGLESHDHILLTGEEDVSQRF